MGTRAFAARCQHHGLPASHSARAARIQGSFPDHAIALETGDTEQLVPALLQHRIDLALTLEAEKEPQLEFHPLFSDELQFLVSPLHPWARAGKVDRTEIPKENHILYSKRSVTFQMIENYFPAGADGSQLDHRGPAAWRRRRSW